MSLTVAGTLNETTTATQHRRTSDMLTKTDRTKLIIASVRLRNRASRIVGMRTLGAITLEFIDRLEAGEFTAEDIRRMTEWQASRV